MFFLVDVLFIQFTISFVNAEQAYFVLNEQVTSFCVLTRYSALPEWDFLRLSAFSEVREDLNLYFESVGLGGELGRVP